MPRYTINITDEQDKAVRAHIESCQLWLQSAINNKARICEDRIIRAVTKFNPKRLTRAEKNSILAKVEVEPFSEKRQEKDIFDRLTLIRPVGG